MDVGTNYDHPKSGNPDMKSGEKEYLALNQYSATRYKELSELFEPYVAITDAFGKLVCRICICLGISPPKDTQDSVVRDLTADVFDFLFESRDMILQGKIQIGYVLARRAYESLSLLSLCAQDSEYADKWESGKKISNSEVRKRLAEQPFSESAERTQELYSFFSKFAHPNRDLVAHRYLGQGNRFVFGSIGKPELVFVADFCYRHLQLWFWFGALAGCRYNTLLEKHDPDFIREYFVVTDQAEGIAEWLARRFDHLLKEA